LAGCAPTKVQVPIASPAPPLQTPFAPQGEYTFQLGDQLDVKFFYNPELNESVVVRPDGRISLQLVGEIMAFGLTPAQLTKQLRDKYASEIKQPEITVIVKSFGGQNVYVDGEVNKPGMLPLAGFMTVVQAISQAGGMKESGEPTEVILIRHGAGNRPTAVGDIENSPKSDILGQASCGIRTDRCIDFPV